MPVSAATNAALVFGRATSAPTSSATPVSAPITTRPIGPIHALSTAYLKKKRAPTTKTPAPIRVSQTMPSCSSRVAGGEAEIGAGAGGGVGVGPGVGVGGGPGVAVGAGVAVGVGVGG